MTPFEAVVVLSTIAIGTHLTNTLLIHSIDMFTDLNARLLCSETSTNSTSTASVSQYIHHYLSRLIARSYPWVSSTSSPGYGYLTFLPRRQPRSTSKAPASAQKSTFLHLRTCIQELADTYPDHVYLAHSTFSPKGNISLHARSRSQARTSYHGEIGHVHLDGSMHFILHPSDAALAVSTGWIHSAARSYCSVFAPSTDSDLNVVREIVKAAIWYARGKGDGTLREEENMLQFPM